MRSGCALWGPLSAHCQVPSPLSGGPRGWGGKNVPQCHASGGDFFLTSCTHPWDGLADVGEGPEDWPVIKAVGKGVPQIPGLPKGHEGPLGGKCSPEREDLKSHFQCLFIEHLLCARHCSRLWETGATKAPLIGQKRKPGP